MNEEMRALIRRRKRAAEEQVRVAYGAVPEILEAFPADGPFRTAIRDRARSLLVAVGCLTAEELDTLPEKGAIAAAMRRCRTERSRLNREREPAPQSAKGTAGIASRTVRMSSGGTRDPV